MNSFEFIKELTSIFVSEFQKQYPECEQGSLLYTIYLDILNNFHKVVFMKKSSEYYSISDADIYVNKRDDRDLLIKDLCESNDVIRFMGNVCRNYYIKEVEWRRISIYQTKTNQ